MRAVFVFLAGSMGRVVRAVAGVALFAIGLFAIDGPLSWVLEMVALVPLLAGVFDVCVFAPLFGLPFVGSRLRQALQGEQQ